MVRSLVRTLVPPLLATTLTAVSVAAQVIPVRTVPLATGDQFLLLPTATLGMGGITLAVDDSLADPWTNPAKGVFVTESAFLGSPTFYGISSAGGAGRTFPLAGMFRNGAWFGGFGVALQQIENDDGDTPPILWRADVWWQVPNQRLSDASSRNLFAQAFLGRSLGDGPWSVGVGVSLAGLDAMDGVDLLYANAESIEQSGTLGDVRLGLYRSTERDRLGLLLVHDRVSMTHDVSYVDVRWDTVTWNPVFERRTEENLDRTRTWGAELSWDRSLSAPGWRVGTQVTANRKSHPKIPNYEIQNIPRDPGTTWAYEAGLGVSRTRDGTTFGVDVVLQPIWSDTWQEAAADTVTPTGSPVREGERTIENDFFFTNVMLRAGFEHRFGVAAVQAGLEARSYDYELEQRNHLDASFRTQHESWIEWSPSAGVSYRFDDVELRYAGRLTTGTGRPGVAFTDVAAGRLEAMADFIVAPQAPLTLQDATVLTHQISVRVPIR